MARDCCCDAFLLGTVWGSHWGGLSQELGAQVTCCSDTGKQRGTPHSPSLCTSAHPAWHQPCQCARPSVVSAVTVTALIRGYTEEHRLDEEGNKAALASAWGFETGVLAGLSAVQRSADARAEPG